MTIDAEDITRGICGGSTRPATKSHLPIDAYYCVGFRTTLTGRQPR